MAATASKSPAPAPVGDLLTITRRPAPYRLNDRASRAATGEGSFVTRGVHVKTGAPALIHVDGSQMTAIPLGVVGHAIAGGVITPDEIQALQAA